MSTKTESSASIIHALIEICKSGQRGFRSAAESVRNADLKPLFSDLAMQRRLFAGELQSLVRDQSEKVETSGSIRTALDRGWLALKAAISRGDDSAILAECERGEDTAMAEYHEAIDHKELPPKVLHVICDQSKGIEAAHNRVRDFRNRPHG